MYSLSFIITNIWGMLGFGFTDTLRDRIDPTKLLTCLVIRLGRNILFPDFSN